jgi:hypothetical protein
MMTPKALAQLRRDISQARRHLACLEQCAALGPADQPQSILLATGDRLARARARAQVVNMHKMLAEHTPQLELFGQA